MESQLPPESLDLAWPAELMTAREVAGVMRVTPKMVRDHIRRGSLRALQLNGTGPYRVRAEDAQRWADAQLVEPDAAALAVDRYVRRRLVEVPRVESGSRRRRRVGGLIP